MKLMKVLAAVTLTLALLAGGMNLQAQCQKCPAGEKKCEGAKKCCDDAKKAGKSCEKCPKKPAK